MAVVTGLSIKNVVAPTCDYPQIKNGGEMVQQEYCVVFDVAVSSNVRHTILGCPIRTPQTLHQYASEIIAQKRGKPL